MVASALRGICIRRGASAGRARRGCRRIGQGHARSVPPQASRLGRPRRLLRTRTGSPVYRTSIGGNAHEPFLDSWGRRVGARAGRRASGTGCRSTSRSRGSETRTTRRWRVIRCAGVGGFPSPSVTSGSRDEHDDDHDDDQDESSDGNGACIHARASTQVGGTRDKLPSCSAWWRRSAAARSATWGRTGGKGGAPTQTVV